MEEPRNFMKQHKETHSYYSDLLDSFSSESFKCYPNINRSIQVANGELDNQQHYKASKSSSFTPSTGSLSNTFTVSFGDPKSPRESNQYQLYSGSKLKCPETVLLKEETSLNEFLISMDVTRRVRSTRRNQRQAQEHVLAERKRREKLAQRFISLSALLPGLKKMDKSAVLEGARKCIIQLQNRVKELEETSINQEKDMVHGSIVSTRRFKFCGHHEDGPCSSDDTNYLHCSSYNPEIKARIYRNNILVRIYCGKSSSLVLRTLTEMERHHISIICCSVLPFTNITQLITITAKMGDNMEITRKYLVKCLQSALRESL